MMIVVRRPLGVVDTSAPPLSSGSALCPSLVVARKEDGGIKMASLFGKRGDDERDRSSCGEVVPYPVSRLENWIRLLSPSVKGQRGCGEPLIPCIIATSKNRSRFFHLGKRLASNWYIGGTYFLFFLFRFFNFFFFFHGKRFHRFELEKILRNFIF